MALFYCQLGLLDYNYLNIHINRYGCDLNLESTCIANLDFSWIFFLASFPNINQTQFICLILIECERKVICLLQCVSEKQGDMQCCGEEDSGSPRHKVPNLFFPLINTDARFRQYYVTSNIWPVEAEDDWGSKIKWSPIPLLSRCLYLFFARARVGTHLRPSSNSLLSRP